MQRTKKSKFYTAVLAILLFAGLTASCNRGYGCPGEASVTTPAAIVVVG